MALIALLGRRNMELGFAYGDNTVVALAAVPKDFLMIHRGDCGKIRIRVAGLTGIAGRDVIPCFAGRHHAIMTGCAVIDDTGMVEEGTCEANGGVAGDAILGGWNMRYGLTSGPGRGVAAIVAGDAVSVDSLVIESAAGKAGGGMTDVATQGRGNMPLRFTDCCHAMTGIAVVEDAGMIKPGSDKAAGPVAYATVLVGLYVIGRFALGEHAVVA